MQRSLLKAGAVERVIVMNFSQFLYWEQSNYDTVNVKKAYVDVTEDLIAGLLLSQIVYWHLPNKNNESKLRVKKKGQMWLAKGRSDWWEECRISEKQFDRAVKILVDKGIVEKKLFKFDGTPTVHLRLEKDKLMELINGITKENEIHQKGEMDFDERVKSNLPKGQDGNDSLVKNDFAEKVKSITETTTETTAETTTHTKEQVEKVMCVLDKKINYSESKKLLKLANGDIDLIREKYEVAKAINYVNLMATMISAIRENWQMPKEQEDKSKNKVDTKFHNFEQRTSKYTPEELKRMVSRKG